MANRNTTAKNKNKTAEYGFEESKLMKLFEDSLKDIYWAEKALTKALPKMAKKATSDDLVTAIENHLDETEGHVSKVEKVFDVIGKKAAAKKCEAMAGLVKEAEEIMQETEEGAMRDGAQHRTAPSGDVGSRSGDAGPTSPLPCARGTLPPASGVPAPG